MVKSNSNINEKACLKPISFSWNDFRSVTNFVGIKYKFNIEDQILRQNIKIK